MNKELAAYIAGLVDGEGCVSLFYRRKSNKTYITPSIQIANTNQDVLNFLQSYCKGKIYFQKSSFNRGNRKPCWNWVCFGKNAMDVLFEVRPFLIVKKKQADIIISIDGQRDSSGYRIRKRLTKEDFEANEKAIQEIRILNKRGI